MKYFLLVLIFLFGCKETSIYKRKGTMVSIIPARSEISSADISVWRVGPLRRQRLSKGIKVKLDLPQLEKDDLRDLVDNLDIDSWIIRVRKRSLITSDSLDHFYIPLLVPGLGKKDLRIKQIDAGFINLYYSAAAISSRFERFQCPAFKHNKKLNDFDIVEVIGKDRAIRGSKRTSIHIPQKLEVYSYRPFPINAGTSMIGEFRFEIALFNSDKKLRRSNWFELPQAIKVTKEEKVHLTGCSNFKIPENKSNVDTIEDFRFGR